MKMLTLAEFAKIYPLVRPNFGSSPVEAFHDDCGGFSICAMVRGELSFFITDDDGVIRAAPDHQNRNWLTIYR